MNWFQFLFVTSFCIQSGAFTFRRSGDFEQRMKIQLRTHTSNTKQAVIGKCSHMSCKEYYNQTRHLWKNVWLYYDADTAFYSRQFSYRPGINSVERIIDNVKHNKTKIRRTFSNLKEKDFYFRWEKLAKTAMGKCENCEIDNETFFVSTSLKTNKYGTQLLNEVDLLYKNITFALLNEFEHEALNHKKMILRKYANEVLSHRNGNMTELRAVLEMSTPSVRNMTDNEVLDEWIGYLPPYLFHIPSDFVFDLLSFMNLGGIFYVYLQIFILPQVYFEHYRSLSNIMDILSNRV